MNFKSFFFLFLAVLFSCSNSEKTSGVAEVAYTNESVRSVLDTFSIGAKLFSVEQITKEDFEKLPDPALPDTSENNILFKDSAFAMRRGGVLILRVRKNETISFKDDTNSATEGFAKHDYLGRFPEINSYVVLGFFIESFNYFLIDFTSADTSFACGFPIMSPDKSYFICGNVDLIAGFVVNGFDLYEVKNKKIKLVGRKELSKWGPEKIKWLDNSSLLVQRTVLDTTASNMTRTDYVKLLMK